MYVISDYYKASRDVIAFVAGYYEKLFLAELLDQKISIQKWDVCHPRVVPKRLNPDMINMDVDYFVFCIQMIICGRRIYTNSRMNIAMWLWDVIRTMKD